MAYQVLARKYRPQFFRDVVGQEHVTRTLLNALEQGRIAHGYIFSGHRGIGKTTIARILAMALNCQRTIGSPERPTSEPCGTCDACTEIRSGSAVDVIEIDAATNRGIDEIRELRDAARYRPARDRYKIYILDEAHQITDAAFNALLKTLEEPPDHVVFMMATTQPEDIPQTIRSRSQHYAFHAVRFDDILAQLRSIADQEKLDADDAALALLAEAGDGSMRDALSIMDQAIASAPVANGRPHLEATQIRELMGTVPNTVFERLLEWVGENNSAAVMTEIDTLLNAGNSPSQLARQMVRYLRNAVMAKLGGESTELLQISDDERARVARTAMLFAEEDLTRFLQIMLRSFDEMNYRQEPRFHLELGLLKLVHTQRLIPLEQILSQMPGGAGNISRPGPAPARSATAAGPSASPAPLQRTAAPQAAPPRSVVSTESARGGSAASSTPPGQPTFSPFESDTRRKSGPSGSATTAAPVESSPAESSTPQSSPSQSPYRYEPSDAAALAHHHVAVGIAVAVDEAPVPETEEASELHHEPPDPQIRGHASSEVERHVADLEEEIASDGDPEPPASGEFISLVDKLRDAVTQALYEKGRETASTLLRAARWNVSDTTITAEVAIGKIMLSVTMDSEAERIARTALQQAGSNLKLMVMPGDGTASPVPPAAPVAKGSLQAHALENPLVKQAQELFRAEVRDVLDLRGRR